MGGVSLFWMVQSSERDSNFAYVNVGLTNKLIGKRILFIKKGEQSRYDSVESLADFRKLQRVAGMGKNWFDVKVWQQNKLLVKEHSGDWKEIFRMIPNGWPYHYISRGVNEILTESIDYPELVIEQRLALIYDRRLCILLELSRIKSRCSI